MQHLEQVKNEKKDRDGKNEEKPSRSVIYREVI